MGTSTGHRELRRRLRGKKLIGHRPKDVPRRRREDRWKVWQGGFTFATELVGVHLRSFVRRVHGFALATIGNGAMKHLTNLISGNRRARRRSKPRSDFNLREHGCRERVGRNGPYFELAAA